MRHSLVHYGHARAALARGRTGGNRVVAGLTFFGEEGERLVSLDPIDVERRLMAREVDDGTEAERR